MARIILGPNVRFSFANVFAPNKDGKYAVDVLINKQDTATLNQVFQAYNEVLGTVAGDARFKNVNHQHPSFKHCLKDGDVFKPNDHTYAGHYYFVARSQQRPEVVGPAREPLSSESQFYSGCYGNVSVEFKTYAPSTQVPGSGHGVRCMLGNIQKVSDGERLSGGASASSEFSQVGPPSTGTPAAPAQFGAPAAPQTFGAPAPQAPYGQPAQAPAWGAPAAPQQFGAPAAPAPNPFGPPAPNPFVQPQQGAPVPQGAPQFPGAPQQFGAPAPQGFPAPQPQGAPVNPAAPQAPWPGAAAPAPASQPVMPWAQNQYPQ